MKRKWIDFKAIVIIVIAAIVLYVIWFIIAWIATPRERELIGFEMKGKTRFIPTHKIDQQTEDAKEYTEMAINNLEDAISQMQVGNNNYSITLMKNALYNIKQMKVTLWKTEQ